MKSITPFLWFESGAAEVADFYLEVFEDSERISSMPGPGDDPMGVTLRVKNLELTLFNGGPTYKLDEAFSLMVICDDQDEVDRLWDVLTADGGSPVQCGWLKDKFGVSWQIVPAGFLDLVFGPDPEGSKRAFDAMLKMVKLDLAGVAEAYDGK